MPTPPPIQNLARQLLAIEAAAAGPSNVDANRAVLVCEKLRVPITRLAGAAGFCSLLSRAVALARRPTPSLEALRVGAGGLLTGFNEVGQNSGTAEAARDWGAVLVAELLGLLVELIGEPLTLSLLREAWPDVSIESVTRMSSEEKP